jgi:hypothetical protein
MVSISDTVIGLLVDLLGHVAATLPLKSDLLGAFGSQQTACGVTQEMDHAAHTQMQPILSKQLRL